MNQIGVASTGLRRTALSIRSFIRSLLVSDRIGGGHDHSPSLPAGIVGQPLRHQARDRLNPVGSGGMRSFGREGPNLGPREWRSNAPPLGAARTWAGCAPA